MVQSAVREALDGVYAAFGSVPKPTSIDACPCCINDAEICSLLSTSLREITPEQLSGYASSVFLTAGSLDDFRYSLPRILDVSLHDTSWWPDREVVLSRLAEANWLTWDQLELDALYRLFHAAFVAAMTVAEDSTENLDAYDSASDIDSWICGLALSGADLLPFLKELEESSRIEILAAFFEDNEKSVAVGTLRNAFWEGHHPATAPVVAWFNSATVQEALLAYYLEHDG